MDRTEISVAYLCVPVCRSNDKGLLIIGSGSMHQLRYNFHTGRFNSIPGDIEIRSLRSVTDVLHFVFQLCVTFLKH